MHATEEYLVIKRRVENSMSRASLQRSPGSHASKYEIYMPNVLCYVLEADEHCVVVCQGYEQGSASCDLQPTINHFSDCKVLKFRAKYVRLEGMSHLGRFFQICWMFDRMGTGFSQRFSLGQ